MHLFFCADLIYQTKSLSLLQSCSVKEDVVALLRVRHSDAKGSAVNGGSLFEFAMNNKYDVAKNVTTLFFFSIFCN